MVISAESLAVIGGAIALAGGLAGTSLGLGASCSAGAATLAEEPGQLRNVVVLASLPMTQTFYGLIQLILVLTRVLPTLAAMPDPGGKGLAVLGIGLIGGSAEWFSAWAQGWICASAISLLPKTRGKILTNGILMAVFAELFGVLGMVFTILALSLLGLF